MTQNDNSLLHHQTEAKHNHAAGFPTHRPKERRRLLWAIGVTVVMMVVEVVGGFFTGSLALISDAGHMLTHVFALGVSLVAIIIASRPAPPERSFGYYRSEVLAALLNGVTLFFLAGYIFYEAYQRLRHPQEILGLEMMVIAAAGLVVNLGTALILHGASQDDLNVKSAFFHLLGDLVSSIVVIIGAVIIWRTGWVILDPLLSVLVCFLILVWSWRLIADAVHILMESAPRGLAMAEVKSAIEEACPVACDVHDLHLWVISSGMTALSSHIAMDETSLAATDRFSQAIRQSLKEKYGIKHAVLQFERVCSNENANNADGCCLAPERDNNDE